MLTAENDDFESSEEDFDIFCNPDFINLIESFKSKLDAIFIIENAISKQKKFDLEELLNSNLIPLLIAKIEHIENFKDNLKFCSSIFHTFALVTRSKLPIFNRFISEELIMKLVLCLNLSELPDDNDQKNIIFNAMLCISNIISISDFTLTKFFQLNILQVLSPFCQIRSDNIFIQQIQLLCAKIHKRCAKFFNNKNIVNYIQIFNANLISIIQAGSEDSICLSFIAFKKLIDKIPNDLPLEFYQSLINVIKPFSKTQSPYIFVSLLLLLFSLLDSDNVNVYTIFIDSANYFLLEILRRGFFDFSSINDIFNYTARALCKIIVFIPKFANFLNDSGIIQNILLNSDNLNFKGKQKLAEILCRLIFSEEHAILHQSLYESGLVEFLSDCLLNKAQNTLEILDALYYIHSHHPEQTQKMFECSIIETLDQIMFNFEEYPEEKAELLYSSALELKEMLIEYSATHELI